MRIINFGEYGDPFRRGRIFVTLQIDPVFGHPDRRSRVGRRHDSLQRIGEALVDYGHPFGIGRRQRIDLQIGGFDESYRIDEPGGAVGFRIMLHG